MRYTISTIKKGDEIMRKKCNENYIEAARAMREAIEDRDIKLRNFHNCTPEFFEVANRELTMAQEKVDICLSKYRQVQLLK
jgi:hypothetical protein